MEMSGRDAVGVSEGMARCRVDDLGPEGFWKDSCICI
jgi:hypothetical protein